MGEGVTRQGGILFLIAVVENVSTTSSFLVLKVLEKVEKAESWLNDKEEEQVKKKPHEHPAFLSSDVPRQLEPMAVAFRKFERIPKPIVKYVWDSVRVFLIG